MLRVEELGVDVFRSQEISADHEDFGRYISGLNVSTLIVNEERIHT